MEIEKIYFRSIRKHQTRSPVIRITYLFYFIFHQYHQQHGITLFYFILFSLVFFSTHLFPRP